MAVGLVPPDYIFIEGRFGQKSLGLVDSRAGWNLLVALGLYEIASLAENLLQSEFGIKFVRKRCFGMQVRGVDIRAPCHAL